MTLLDEIKRPFNVLTLSIAILSIALSVFLYFESQQYREISFKVDRVAKIWDRESGDSLRVVVGDSLATDNIYLVSGTVWNSGNLEIAKEDIRESISIKFSGPCKILVFKITKQSPESSAFSLARRDSLLELSWKYFDPDAGIRFQIILEAEDEPKIDLVGRVLGVKKIVYENNLREATIDFPFILFVTFIGFTFVSILFLLITQNDFLYRDMPKLKRADNLLLIVAIAMILVITLILLLKAYFWTNVPTF